MNLAIASNLAPQSLEAIAAQFRADNPDVEWDGNVEEFQRYSEYANPGYDSGIGVVVGDWNGTPRGFDSAVEAAGYVLDWADEVSMCDGCNKAIHTTPGYYGDTPAYAIVHECEMLCFDCLKDEAEEWLESLENNPRQAVNVRGIDPSEYGYTRVEGGFENGFYPGQNDNPSDIYNRLHSQYPRLLFVIDSVGQFDINFSVWTKNAEVEFHNC